MATQWQYTVPAPALSIYSQDSRSIMHLEEEGACALLSFKRRTPHSPKFPTRFYPMYRQNSLYMYPSSAPVSPAILRREGDRRPRVAGGRRAISEALQHHELKERFGSLVSLADTGKDTSMTDKPRMRGRRMSTPHPIKTRVNQGPPALNRVKSRKGRLRRSSSAPDLVEDGVKRRKKSLFQTLTAQAGDLAVEGTESSEDEEEDTPDATSLGAASETSSCSSSGGRHSRFEEIFEEEGPTYAEALWDHVTLDPLELAFCVGDVIEVTEMSSKDWWWGTVDGRVGWFPAAFVRRRVNQCETAVEFAQKVKDGHWDTQTALEQYSSGSMVSRDQARINVVNEILQAEREYVGNLKNVIEGYLNRARRRPEMFAEERLTTIFGNMEAIYRLSQQFLADLNKHYMQAAPETSQLGQCFLRHEKGFEIYSVYCNNHPFACEELRLLQKNKSYLHFFEACRLLQQMIEIPLEGFLLTPVQKICKYPLQLRELLKYTRPEHPDYQCLQDALEAMKHIASLINERKRKMESLEKLGEWQDSIDDWQGEDLIERSSELIHSGELTKVNTSGWHQDRVFFLFDHQLIYCKKDLLWRDLLVYKGCIDMDQCTVESIQDGKDLDFNVSIKHGFKLHDQGKDKSFLLYCRSTQEKERWLRAFNEERRRVKLDEHNGFDLKEFKQQAAGTYLQKRLQDRQRDKSLKKKQKISQMCHRQGYLQNLPSHATLPKSINPRDVYGTSSRSKRSFFTKKHKR